MSVIVIHGHIIPTTLDLSDDYRKRRGLGSCIGGELSSVFGLVDEDLINEMKDNVQSMLEAFRHDMQEMKKLSGHVSTYMKASNLRLDGLVESLKSVQKDSFEYEHSIGDSLTQQIQMLAPLTGFITKGTDNMKSLEYEFRNLLTALEALVAGHLSPYLFPVSMLTKIMDGISESLWNNYGRTIWLAQRDPHYYYQTADFSFQGKRHVSGNNY